MLKVRLSVFVRIVLLILVMMGTSLRADAQTPGGQPVDQADGLSAPDNTADPESSGFTGSRSGSTDTTPPVQYDSPANFSEDFYNISNLPGWYMQNNSYPLGSTDWLQGNGVVFPAHAGAPTSYIAASYNNASGLGTISNWLLTPEQDLADGATFSFWTRTPTGSQYPDRLQVRLSTNGPSTDVGTGAEDLGDFTTLLEDINPNLEVGGYPEVWTQYVITLNGIPEGSSGRFAFRYYVTNGGPSGSNSNYIGIDTVEFIEAPSITLTKTVGTDPTVCAATDQISVVAGTTVTYCYEVTNTGGVTLSYHDLVDDQLGVILDNFHYILAPDASAFLTQTVVITEAVVNTATWTARDGPSIAEASDTATVDILQPGISLVKTVGTDPHVCAATDQISVVAGTTVTYCYEVTNTGDVTLTYHDLVDDQLGVILDNFPYSLAPSASAFLTQTVVITEVVVNTATWTAWNGPSIAEASDTATVDILQPGISLVKTVGTEPGVCAATDQISVVPGTTVYYCYTVTNTGDVALDLHDLQDDQLGTLFSGLSYALAPSSSVNTVAAGLTISAVITTTTVNTATWTAYNIAGPSVQAEATATVVVEELDYYTFLPIVTKH